MRLVVFFSRGMSLAGWQRAGILDRELALYRELLPHLEHLAFVTYGGAEDVELGRQIPGVGVLPNLRGLPPNLYSVISPWLHRGVLRQATVFKTQQLNGAWSAVIAKRWFGKTLVVRCGFIWSDFVGRLGEGRLRHAIARRLERLAFQRADRAIVASDADRDVVLARYGLPKDAVEVIPNFVDTTMFRPMPDVARELDRVTFVGRLDEVKNVTALVEAIAGLPGVRLTVVGEGPLRPSLEARVRAQSLPVEFLGRVSHAELPALLNRSAVFVLPSHYEGNPKALVEAMACGVPVVGARAPGIREILVDGETGVLCGTSPADIRAALQTLLADAGLRARVAAGGLAYARNVCSLKSAAAKELALLRALHPARG